MTEPASARPGIGGTVGALNSDASDKASVKARAKARSAQARAPTRLKKRADFVRAARGKRVHATAFTLQGVERGDGATAAAPRIGLTVTRKTGGAVERNRMRRRLKEALRQLEDFPAYPGHDYVLVLRRPALSERFDQLRMQLSRSFGKISGASIKHRRAEPAAIEAPD